MKSDVVNVLGFDFINRTTAQFIHQLQDDLSQNKSRFVVTANPEIVMYAKKHPEYAAIIKTADYLTPDGIGIVKAANFGEQHLTERVTGYDIFTAMLDWGNSNHAKVYLLGSKPSVIKKTVAKIQAELPNLEIVGYHDGYFEDGDPIAADIEATQPDMVFIATGFPKQEEFIHRYQHLSCGLWMGIGGSFDVYSGTVARAPKFWQDHNLEWFYRLATNPKRLKRQLVLPVFLFQAYLEAQKRKSE